MAFRIDKSIVKGWLDNTTPGITRGGLEIMGMEQPVKILLRGNCWRDLAGTRIDFTNPNPEYQQDILKNLQPLQRGVVSDMTASKRVKELTVDPESPEHKNTSPKDLPFTLKNALSLEWFSLVNGRVIIETSDFEVHISKHHWELDKIGEKKQLADNADAMQHFMEIMLTASEAQAEINDTEGEVDEFEWEKRLRVRDTLEEASWFLADGPAITQIETFEVEEVSLKDRVPIIQHAILVQNQILDILGDSIPQEGTRTDLVLAISYIYDSLDEIWPTQPIRLENGYILAVLKRALEACNCAIADCNALSPEDQKFEGLRAHIFHLRDLMVDKSHALRESEQAE